MVMVVLKPELNRQENQKGELTRQILDVVSVHILNTNSSAKHRGRMATRNAWLKPCNSYVGGQQPSIDAQC